MKFTDRIKEILSSWAFGLGRLLKPPMSLEEVAELMCLTEEEQERYRE